MVFTHHLFILVLMEKRYLYMIKNSIFLTLGAKRLLGLVLVLCATGVAILLFFLPGVLFTGVSFLIILACLIVPFGFGLFMMIKPQPLPAKIVFGIFIPAFGALFLVIALPALPDITRPFGMIFCPDGYTDFIPAVSGHATQSDDGKKKEAVIGGTCDGEYGTIGIKGSDVVFGMVTLYLILSYAVVGIAFVCNFFLKRVEMRKKAIVYAAVTVLLAAVFAFVPFLSSPVFRMIHHILYRGNTPLLVAAAENDNRPLIGQLLEQGVRIDSKDEQQRTALHAAAAKSSRGLVLFLLQQGASIDACDNNGETPLMKAVYCRNTETIRLLIQHGADTTIKNNKGKTALDIAIAEEAGEIMEILQQM
jgi:hypothetical protein